VPPVPPVPPVTATAAPAREPVPLAASGDHGATRDRLAVDGAMISHVARKKEWEHTRSRLPTSGGGERITGEVLERREVCRCGAVCLPHALVIRSASGEIQCGTCARTRGYRLMFPVR
jgi:hypothetical protein